MHVERLLKISATFKTQRLMMCYSLADIAQQTCIRSDMVHTLVKTELTTLRSSSTDNFFGAELKARIEIRSQTIQLYYTEYPTTSNQHVHLLQCLTPSCTILVVDQLVLDTMNSQKSAT